MFGVMRVDNRQSPKLVRIVHRHKQFVVNHNHFTSYQTPIINRIRLNRVIHQNVDQQIPDIMDYLIPDEGEWDDEYIDFPNYLNHLAFCALSNDEIDTSDFVNYIDEQYDRLMVNLYQWDLLPIEFFVKLKLFLSDTEEGKFRNICKFSNFVCDLPPNFCDELDTDYRRWLALPYNMDCLKQAFIERITMDDLRQLIVFDVRALDDHTIDDIIDNFDESQKKNVQKPFKIRHSLFERTFNKEFFGILGELADKNSYLNCLSINYLWLTTFGDPRILSRVKWNRAVIIKKKQYKKWNPCKSSWYVFSAASYFSFSVVSQYIHKFHPSHMTRFTGNGLRMYEGLAVWLNVVKCNLSDLKFVSLFYHPGLHRQIHRSWYGFADYLNQETKVSLDYFYVSGCQYRDFDVFIRAKTIMFQKGHLDYFDLCQIFRQGEYPFCVLWGVIIARCITGDEWDKPRMWQQNTQCNLILYECKHIVRILEWQNIFTYISNVTIVLRYRAVSRSDILLLRELIISQAPNLNQLIVILWDNDLQLIPRQRFVDNGAKIMAMLRANLSQIKKNTWNEIKFGLSYNHVLDLIRTQEDIINVSQLTTKFDIDQAGTEWTNIITLQEKEIDEDAEEEEIWGFTQPVRDMWNVNAHLWSHQP